MIFEKKLIILSGERSAKGTLTLERNAYGMFAMLNLYNLPDLSEGEYCAGLRSGERFEIHKLGAKGRILDRFATELTDLSAVHCVVFDSVRETALLYGTNTPAKLWHGNMMDGFRRKQNEQTQEVAQTTAELPSYSGRNGEIRDYFFDILPGERIEVPKDNAERLKPGMSEKLTDGPQLTAPKESTPKQNEQKERELQESAPNHSERKESEPNQSASKESEPNQSASKESEPDQGEAACGDLPLALQNEEDAETLTESASSLLQSARSITAEYNDAALAEVNYYEEPVTYSSLEDVHPDELLNPVDRSFREKEPHATKVQSVPQTQPPESACPPLSLRGHSVIEQPAVKTLKPQKRQPMCYAGETAFTIPPVSAYTAGSSASKVRPQTVFYEQIKSQIDGLFAEGERFQLLEDLMEETRWVRVNYDEKRFYAVGLIGARPDYICYAVPAEYTKVPPEELGDNCRWLPEKPEEPEGRGYWLMFQSAVTGEPV